MDIREILAGLGYKDTPGTSWYDNITLWLAWYSGKSKFHAYTVYNGSKHVGCTRKTLGMAKKIAEDKADLLLNEKVEIVVTPKNATNNDEPKVNLLQEYVDAVLDANNFWVRGNQLVELAHALGTGAFVEFLDGKDVRIDYVPAMCIVPLRWRNREITECAFASKLSTGDNEQTYVQLHRIYDKDGVTQLDRGNYVVSNKLFGKDGKEKALPQGVEAEWKTGSAKPMYQIIMPNIANNIDISSPMGVSVYSNAIDDLETVDMAYDSFHNEFKLGKKRVFVDDSMLKPNPVDQTLMPIFDTNDTLFYGIPMNDGAKPIHESNPELRIDDHIKGIQAALDVLSEKCGFGKGYYKFDGDNMSTATQVISQNSKLYRRVRKDVTPLEKALVDMTRAILFLGGKGTDAAVSINSDDSIIEDTDAKANRAMREKTAGIIDDVEYFMETRNLDEEAAQELVKKIAERRPPEPPTPDLFGGGA